MERAPKTHNQSTEPTPDQALAMLESMILIRRTEEQLGADSKAGKLPGNVHAYVGQEAIAVGVCAHLVDSDYITSTHRGHGHFLAKGGDPSAMVAEIYGRSGGICRGMGGSMHVADLSKGILGANGIVGGGMGIAAGAAFAAQLDKNEAVTVCFFGDGAANQGVLHEVMNIAALWKLPLILVCEHNGFSEFSRSETVTAGLISERAKPFGIPSQEIDGNDVTEVWRHARDAIALARAGGGPTFIEMKSYRTRGHLEAEAGFIQEKYRPDEEIVAWQQKDPIARLVDRLKADGVLNDESYTLIEKRVGDKVKEAVAFAERSDPPEMSAALDYAALNPRA